VILKVGTLDDPGLYGGPQMAIYTIDKQAFHQIPEGNAEFRAAAETIRRTTKITGREVPRLDYPPMCETSWCDTAMIAPAVSAGLRMG
jgi:hypothetical protein